MDAGYYDQDVGASPSLSCLQHGGETDPWTSDLAMHVEGVKFARRVAATAPMRDMLQLEHSPGPDVQTDEQIRGVSPLSLSSDPRR